MLYSVRRKILLKLTIMYCLLAHASPQVSACVRNFV
jgi:hypothetical protein